ncbi:MAG: hypothetical protein DCF27_10780 [Lysobacteraceae bacterium]|nr:MAG: hypothetical protein DCF27_10780 [Xanthomonadaceae bacterium]
MRLLPFIFPAVITLSLSAVAPAFAADAPYEVIVWADAKYDATGALAALEFPQAQEYAPALLENLRARIAARPASPKLAGDVPATWETGVRVALTVTPETGSVTVDDISDSPLVLRMTSVRFTEDMAGVAYTWEGRVMASCNVTVKGRCSAVHIVSGNADVPHDLREVAKRTVAEWRFKPQKLAGRAVEGKLVVPMAIERVGVSRPTLRGREY